MSLKNRSDDEDRNYKFDARLRYVENLINAHIVFIQIDNEKQCNVNISPRIMENWRKALMDLFVLLRLHDDELEEPNFSKIDREYIDKLRYHNEIKELTQNKLKKDDPSQAIRNKFKI